MKKYSNKEILEKSSNIVLNKYLSIVVIGLSILVANIFTQDVNATKLIHALITGVSCGIVIVLTYFCLFSIVYIVMYLPKAITWRGNIHRLEFLGVLIVSGTLMLFNRTLYSPEKFGLEYKTTNLMFIIGMVVLLFLFYVQICACLKRLNDLKWSKWLGIIFVIPYVSIVFTLLCLFIKGKLTPDEYTETETENTFSVNNEPSNSSLLEFKKKLIKIFSIIIIFMLGIFFLGYLIQAPLGLHIFYEKYNKCSVILEQSCCGYKNYFGITKIQPVFDYCSDFIDGHAKVRQDIRIQGYTADEWEWFAKNPENPFMYQNEPLPSNYDLPKFNGNCINKYGEPISNKYCE